MKIINDLDSESIEYNNSDIRRIDIKYIDKEDKRDM